VSQVQAVQRLRFEVFNLDSAKAGPVARERTPLIPSTSSAIVSSAFGFLMDWLIGFEPGAYMKWLWCKFQFMARFGRRVMPLRRAQPNPRIELS
jgi:hypothetical protein